MHMLPPDFSVRKHIFPEHRLPHCDVCLLVFIGFFFSVLVVGHVVRTFFISIPSRR